MFENRVQENIEIFMEGRRDGWRKRYYKAVHSLYSSPNMVWMMKSGIKYAAYVTPRKKNVYKGMLLNPEGKRSFGSPRRKWEDNIDFKYDLRAYTGFTWFRIEAGGRLLCKRHWIFGSIKCSEIFD
jgi:hypothetical protein